MNTFSISKSFTAVVVLLVALNGWAAADSKAESTSSETFEQCYPIELGSCIGKCKVDPKAKDSCEKDCENVARYIKCNGKVTKEDKKDAEAKCTTLISDYKKINEKIKSQCARAQQGNTEKCKNLANTCGKSLDVGGFENDGEETPEESENILKQIYGIYSGKEDKKPSAADSCTIEDDEDKEATNTERINEKISKLKTDISSLKEDVAKADDDVAKKKQEVDEKILEIEKEMDKKTAERKTADQKETLEMQKAALEAIKRKKAGLKAIEEKNRIIGNLRLTQQEEAIKFTEINLAKGCRDQALQIKARMIEDAIKAAATSNQSTAVTGNIKKDIQTFALTCIKLAAIERNKAFKSTLDKITIENSAIKDLNDTIKLDDQAAANLQKDLEARKKNSDDEQTKAEEKKTKELGQLSQKVADIQALVEKKKITLAEKAKAKEDEIKQLILRLNNKTPRFQKISADISEGSIQAYL